MVTATEVKEPLLTLTLTPIAFDQSVTQENWILIEDAKNDIPEGVVLRFKLVEFLKGRAEAAISGEEMKNRSKIEKAHHGQKLAELLARNQSQIPKEWRQFNLAFPGTVWQRRDDRRLVIPYLSWFEGQWILCFGWLGRGWNDRVRLVCFRSLLTENLEP